MTVGLDDLDGLEFRLRRAEVLNVTYDHLLRRERERRTVLEADLKATRYDPMCGEPLLTKTAYFSALEDALATTPTPVSVVIFDLDGFKQINERHNHMVGDKAIQVMGYAVTRALQSPELPSAVAGRFGGDEFGLIVYGNKDEAVAVAQSIAAELNGVQGVEHNGRQIPLQLRATYGVASSTEESHPRTLFELADTRLVYGKNKLGEKGHVLAEHIPDPEKYLCSRFIDSFVNYDGDPSSISPRGTPFKGLRSLVDVATTLAKQDGVVEQSLPETVRSTFAQLYAALAQQKAFHNPTEYQELCGRVYDQLIAFDRACVALAPVYQEGRVGVHRDETRSLIHVQPLVQFHQHRYGYITAALNRELESLCTQVHSVIAAGNVQHIDKYA